MRFNTSLLHAGVQKEANGSTLPPVYQTSAFEQTSATDLEKIFENKAPGFCYTRVGNPRNSIRKPDYEARRRNCFDCMCIRNGSTDECIFKYFKEWE